jgi:flagellar biosynthesis/type III secretory pathway M-ring protein FliF/YscJ
MLIDLPVLPVKTQFHASTAPSQNKERNCITAAGPMANVKQARTNITLPHHSVFARV